MKKSDIVLRHSIRIVNTAIEVIDEAQSNIGSKEIVQAWEKVQNAIEKYLKVSKDTVIS
jgi:uncharacterized protein (DUF736 family)